MPNAWLALWWDDADAWEAVLSSGAGDSSRALTPGFAAPVDVEEVSAGALSGEALSAL